MAPVVLVVIIFLLLVVVAASSPPRRRRRLLVLSSASSSSSPLAELLHAFSTMDLCPKQLTSQLVGRLLRQVRPTCGPMVDSAVHRARLCRQDGLLRDLSPHEVMTIASALVRLRHPAPVILCSPRRRRPWLPLIAVTIVGLFPQNSSFCRGEGGTL